MSLSYFRFISMAFLLACAPSIAAASYEDLRLYYDWGDLGPYTAGPKVLGESDIAIPAGTKIEGYVVQLGGETFLATPGEDLKRITLPNDVGIADLKGKYIAGEVASSDGGVATLGVAVPAPAPTGEPVVADGAGEQSQDASQIDLGDAGVAPDSRFLSFFDRMIERIPRTFIFDGVKLAQYDADIAKERLAETKQLLAENNIEAATAAAEQYHVSIERFRSGVGKIDASKQQDIEHFNKEISGHAALLSGDFATNAPQEFRERLAPVTQATTQALAVLADKKGAPPLTPEMIDRIQAAASLGTLPKGVAVSLFASKNRAEALQGIEAQVQSGFLSGPDADYLRFATVKEHYKGSFDRAHEFSKLEFIKRADEDRKKFEQDPALKKQMEEFGKNFKEGQEPPEHLRRYWTTSVQGENAQQTFRPDKLAPDQFQDPKLKDLYTNVRQQLAPTQGDLEGVARQQSESPRFLPQFEHVFRLAGSGTREDAPQERREGFGGCKNAEECVNQAKEFQQQYATPEARREAFGQQFRRLEQREPFPGDPNRRPEFQGRPQSDQGQRHGQQPQQPQEHPGNQPGREPGFWNASYPNPKDIGSWPGEQNRPTPNQPPSSAPAPHEGSQYPSGGGGEFRPPENTAPSGGSGGGEQAPPPPPSGGDGGGGGNPPPPPPPQ